MSSGRSECQSGISPTYEFVLDILQEGKLGLEEVQCCYGNVFAPWDVESPQTLAVLRQVKQGSEEVKRSKAQEWTFLDRWLYALCGCVSLTGPWSYYNQRGRDAGVCAGRVQPLPRRSRWCPGSCWDTSWWGCGSARPPTPGCRLWFLAAWTETDVGGPGGAPPGKNRNNRN